MARQKNRGTERTKRRIVNILSSLNERELESIQNILVTSLVVHEARKQIESKIPKSSRGEFLN